MHPCLSSTRKTRSHQQPRMAVRRGLQLAFQVYQDNDDAVNVCVSPAATVQLQPPVDPVPKQRHLLASVPLSPH
ncbi:hypothetical protein CKAH01_04105 [Colletotrichum kahawae]|uniref:Uncharacterized protein n=1 Tax=Colletotrichum kahawae TaxID=34407 RepID=A0AAE0D9V0_COLKA|nr:hypothetical protein CKAH01_04105 [Colletotrichum kahawae]